VLFHLSDFSRLVEGHLEQDDPTSSAGSQSETPQETGPGKRYQPRTHGAPSSSAHISTQHTPVNTSFALQQPGSAVFKVGGLLTLYKVVVMDIRYYFPVILSTNILSCILCVFRRFQETRRIVFNFCPHPSPRS
jgi:hypothetical protein